MTDSLFSSAVIGTAMPLQLTWPDLVIRLLCMLIAGAIIGYDRGERSKAAGLRTTVLVCMAGSVAMLQMNYLLPLAGRSADSFVTNDLMRLPLGILTGVGFIGGGAILRRGNLVVGVTTAATLWYVTVVGLCFGGGQISCSQACAGLRQSWRSSNMLRSPSHWTPTDQVKTISGASLRRQRLLFATLTFAQAPGRLS